MHLGSSRNFPNSCRNLTGYFLWKFYWKFLYSPNLLEFGNFPNSSRHLKNFLNLKNILYIPIRSIRLSIIQFCLYISFNLSIYLFIYLSISYIYLIYIHLFFLSIYIIYLSIYLSIFRCMYLSIYYIYLSFYLLSRFL